MARNDTINIRMAQRRKKVSWSLKESHWVHSTSASNWAEYFMADQATVSLWPPQPLVQFSSGLNLLGMREKTFPLVGNISTHFYQIVQCHFPQQKTGACENTGKTKLVFPILLFNKAEDKSCGKPAILQQTQLRGNAGMGICLPSFALLQELPHMLFLIPEASEPVPQGFWWKPHSRGSKDHITVQLVCEPLPAPRKSEVGTEESQPLCAWLFPRTTSPHREAAWRLPVTSHT